jgi:hypothetical protein
MFMTSLPLTKKNLKNFMKAYSEKMQSKKQDDQKSVVSFGATSRRSASVGSRRSRSKGRPKISKGRAKSLRHQAIARINSSRKIVKPIVEQLTQKSKSLALAKSGFFDVKSKDDKQDLTAIQKEVDQLQKELQLAVGAFRAGLGDRPIRMKLSAAFAITTTVTSGVTNTVTIATISNAINPSFATEWSSLSALFEEYRIFGGHCKFNYINRIESISASINSGTIPCMAYDADDATSATSTLLLTQTAQHRLYSTWVGTATQAVAPAAGITHEFSFHIPKGDATGGSGTNIPGTQWNPVAAVTTHGYLKFFHQAAVVTAIDTGAGIIYYDLEFRCRA